MSAPDVRRYVGVCMACHHWQVDVRPGKRSWLWPRRTLAHARSLGIDWDGEVA